MHTIFDVSSKVTEEVVNELKAIDGVIRVRVIK